MASAPTAFQWIAAAIFALAVIHTFSTRFFSHLAHVQPRHAGLWHLLGEVEAVFGVWAVVLIAAMIFLRSPGQALEYFEGRDFTEPAFLFVVMVIAASRPVAEAAAMLLGGAARLLPFRETISFYFCLLAIGPMLGSFITEPAAMTLCALLLRNRYMSGKTATRFKYASLGALFVNVSIGGVLTSYAAPPVLMVADTWNWDTTFMLTTFGWKAAIAVLVNAAVVTYLFRRDIGARPDWDAADKDPDVPFVAIAVHLGFLAVVVIAGHHPLVFLGTFLFFLGYTEAYPRFQSPLILREGLMVAFFLAGLVTLGGQQEWWLRRVLSGLDPTAVFFGSAALTTITDNAALTYLGSLIEDVSGAFQYSLVAGAVAAGGLTVIANAPNPAGFAILKGSFADGAISPLWLAVAAAGPTVVALLAFGVLPG
jgi:hypothetical protein